MIFLISYFDYQNIERVRNYLTNTTIFNESNNIVRFCLGEISDDEYTISNFEIFLKYIVPKCGLTYNSNRYIPVYKENEINIFTKDSIFRFQCENLNTIKIDDLLTIIFKGK